MVQIGKLLLALVRFTNGKKTLIAGILAALGAPVALAGGDTAAHYSSALDLLTWVAGFLGLTGVLHKAWKRGFVQATWNWLNGKKTIIAGILAALHVLVLLASRHYQIDLSLLSKLLWELAMLFGVAGIVHKILGWGARAGLWFAAGMSDEDNRQLMEKEIG